MKTAALLLFSCALGATCSAPAERVLKPNDLNAGVHFIRGMSEPGRQPDSNMAVLDARGGLIVFDTGRHAFHTQKILDYASDRQKPVIAIFNSHWHLDHISGNRMLREAFPRAAVYSSEVALTEALNGFLARGAENNRKAMVEGTLSPDQLEDVKGDLATIASAARLHPTIPIERSRALTIGGRRIEVHFAKGASSGDLWLYDPETRLVLAGDLITMPAPLLDTACPAAWSAALDELLQQPFERVIPGHGRVMTHADATIYRDGFNALWKCAQGTAEAAACADEWAMAVAPLLDGAEADGRAARSYVRYYVDELFRKTDWPGECSG